MRLSVAMATYNGAVYLEAQLDSLAAQTCRPDELVVCDDTSTDGTVALLEAFARRSPFPVHLSVNTERLGPAGNFEQAIRQCQGEIIALCDQDDVWHPNKLSRLVASFATPEVGAAFSDAELIDAAGSCTHRRLWPAVGLTPRKQRQARHGRLFDVLVAHNVVTGATMAFRATYRQQVLPIPRIWMHDGWMALIIAAIADVSLIAEPLMKYRIHAQQTVGVDDRGLPDAFKQAWNDPEAYSTTIRRACATVTDQLAVARDRLGELPDVRDAREALSHLDAKIAHLRTRANLPQRRTARVGMVLRELLSARYHRYSLGLLSAARDLVL